MTALSWEHLPMGVMLKRTIVVPDFQREFSWEVEQAEDFLQDLKSFIDDHTDGQYLFGQMVFYREDKNTHCVIDGQQRLATSVIFLSALKELLNDIGGVDANDLILDVNECVGRIRANRSEMHLTLGSKNAQYFKTYIQKAEKKPDKKNGSNGKITKVWNYFKEEIGKEVLNINETEKKINRIEEYFIGLTEGFFVSSVTSEDRQYAFVVFEALNSRGKGLEPGDLIKNHFFRLKGKNKLDDIETQWTDMTKALESVKNDTQDYITQYIRYCWNSMYEFSRKRELFKNITNEIKLDSRTTHPFPNALFSLYEPYITMVDPMKGKAFESKEIIDKISGLKAMRIRAYFPIVLALKYKEYDEKQILETVSNLESMLFRNIIIGNKTANMYEKDLSSYAFDITNGIAIEEINKKIISDTNDDETFRADFKKYKAGTKELSKYILKEIYDQRSPEVEIKKDGNKVHLEHIMPEDVSKWEVEKSVHEKNLNRIGNLTLILGHTNIIMSNAPFKEKKPLYSDGSQITETKDLSNIAGDDWTEDLIELRQDYLFSIARERWPKRDGKMSPLIPDPVPKWRERFIELKKN